MLRRAQLSSRTFPDRMLWKFAEDNGDTVEAVYFLGILAGTRQLGFHLVPAHKLEIAKKKFSRLRSVPLTPFQKSGSYSTRQLFRVILSSAERLS